MFQVEDRHWWYLGLRDTLLRIIDRLDLPPGARVLDAGCGTGGNLAALRQTRAIDAIGLDVSAEASEFWHARRLKRAVMGSVNHIPFRDATFELVFSVDVLESDGVEERAALRELARVLRSSGHLLLVVPGHDWLMNLRHHRAVHARRRYTRPRLRRLLAEAAPDLQVLKMTHLFPSLLPAVAAVRVPQRIFHRDKRGRPTSDIGLPPGPVNSLLLRIAMADARFVRRWGAPFGSSILTLLRKAPT